jgi:crotonobetainyl-CoA:carnitine CoA-transferase CaiB-like acyl-CoA transferase
VPSSETYAGLKVVELTTTIAGPYSAMILADLGADVIKVERPGRGDDARHMPPHQGTDSAVFHAVNRNKRSIAIDVKDPAGKEAFLRLAETADVLVQSFRPGAVDALGLGYAEVSARNPRIVYCSVSAFGDGEAAGGLPGYDPLIQAFCGLMSMTGQPDSEPVRVAASLIDLNTGSWAAMAIMAALARRDRTGAGEHVHATLVDSGYALLCHQIVGMYATGEVPGPLGSASPITAPYEAFRTADGWIMIAAGNDDLFARLCNVIGTTALAEDTRFRDSAARVMNRDQLHVAIEQCLRTESSAIWIQRIQAGGVPVGPVHDLEQAVAHPIAVERGLVIGPGGSGSPLPQIRLPIDDSETLEYPRPPRLGEHTAEVLAEAGLTEGEIAAFL